MQQLQVHSDGANGGNCGENVGMSSGSGGSGARNSKRCGIARFTDASDVPGLANHRHLGSASEAGIVAVLVPPPPKVVAPLAVPGTSSGQKQHQQNRQPQTTSPSMVIELGEDRFALTEALLYGSSHRFSHTRRPVQGMKLSGAAGVIGALCSLAEAIYPAGLGASGRSLHSNDQLAPLMTARQLVLAGEGALLKGLCSRIGWDI